MLSFFQPITAHDAQQQNERIAHAFEREHPAAAAAAAAPPERKRGPGRPPLKRELQQQLPTQEQQPERKPRTGSYTNWFASPYLLDVLHALHLHGNNAKRTVLALQRAAPDDRYARLSDSTIRGWFGNDGKLLPHFQQQLSEGAAAKRGLRPSAMSDAVEKAAKSALLQLRAAGMPVNSHVVRWTLQAVFRQHDPQLLKSLQLSQQWISWWLRSKLKWRWRARTTAASKLPLDWEQQGILMAKRIAAKMEMHEVSLRTLHPVLALSALRLSSHALAVATLAVVLSGASLSCHQHGPDRSEPRACGSVDL
jgi:hypothetical protein